MSIYIGLGANLDSSFGTPPQTLKHLIKTLPKYGIMVLKISRFFKNPAWPDPNDPAYTNACIEIETQYSPQDLMAQLLEIEEKYGRKRSVPNAPRPLDLDIIDYKGRCLDEENLTVPHKGMHERASVLLPLFDIAPNWQHPISKTPLYDLMDDLPDKDKSQTIPTSHIHHLFGNESVLMGILNVTPDSFHDGGAYNALDQSLVHAHEMIQEGAKIIDIGGESTRPGADIVPIDEEINRVVPVIKALSSDIKNQDITLSIDTRNAKTMEAALDAGATMINDVSALTHDPNSIDVAGAFDGPVCLMHMIKDPKSMQNKPTYKDVCTEVKETLSAHMTQCIKAGIAPERLIIDPGIGFGKTLEHNLSLLKNIDLFHDLGAPIMLGVSRKSFIEKICPNTPSQDRLPGSLSSSLYAYSKGVQIFRTHDVAETKQAFDVFSAIEKSCN